MNLTSPVINILPPKDYAHILSGEALPPLGPLAQDRLLEPSLKEQQDLSEDPINLHGATSWGTGRIAGEPLAFGGVLGEAVVQDGMGRGQVGQMGPPPVPHILGSGCLGNPGKYRAREMQTAPCWECSAQ